MTRKIDLAKEIGRWKKKVSDQQKEIAVLKDEISRMSNGVAELNRLTDALLVVMAKEYGTFNQEAEGWTLSLPVFDIHEVIEKFEVKSRKDENDHCYYIGVLPREEEKQ